MRLSIKDLAEKGIHVDIDGDIITFHVQHHDDSNPVGCFVDRFELTGPSYDFACGAVATAINKAILMDSFL